MEKYKREFDMVSDSRFFMELVLFDSKAKFNVNKIRRNIDIAVKTRKKIPDYRETK